MNLTFWTQKFVAAGIDTPLLDAQLLLAHTLGISREDLLMQQEVTLTPSHQQQFDALMARRAAREPMAQIIGNKEFWGMAFEVTSDTLMPRPESETLIETLKTSKGQPSTILDLGTGTGCLLLSALAEFPLATGLGVDINEGALAVARRNAKRLSLENRATFVKSDWISEINGVWDVVISNPPYIPTEEILCLAPEVVQYEPILALDGGRDGLSCYRTIMGFLPSILASDGVALIEVGQGQADEVAHLAQASGLHVTNRALDLLGIERCIVIKSKQHKD